MYQDGDYLQPIGQYNQTICRLQYVMIPPSGREHYSVHSWKAGPDCGKFYYIIIVFSRFLKGTITGGPRLVRILGPGKNRTSEIRTSRYYIVNFH